GTSGCWRFNFFTTERIYGTVCPAWSYMWMFISLKMASALENRSQSSLLKYCFGFFNLNPLILPIVEMMRLCRSSLSISKEKIIVIPPFTQCAMAWFNILAVFPTLGLAAEMINSLF